MLGAIELKEHPIMWREQNRVVKEESRPLAGWIEGRL